MNEKETYLDMAARQLRNAKRLCQFYPNDDGVINDVAYHLQQCIELGIKYFLDCKNITYPKSHNIQHLIDRIPNDSKMLFAGIAEIADKITVLESNTRYLKGYRIALELVHITFSLADDMISTLNNQHCLYQAKEEQYQRENIIWENKFIKGSAEHIFCQNFSKEYQKLNAPTTKDGYDKATVFATKALYFANIPKGTIMAIIDKLAPMVPHQNPDESYALHIIHKVEELESIKNFKNNFTGKSLRCK